ncbi:MAG: PKD domain-containing protein [Bacteroidales bacterium]|nr:PKD domain-containing protein [Bacteroidales bacterium]
MKEKGTYRSIEELYSAKLGEREYPVRNGLWSSLSRKLRFREFMHFNPGSFNIYYLGGLIAAAAIGVALLAGGDSRGEKPAEDIIINIYNEPETVEIGAVEKADENNDLKEKKEAGKTEKAETKETDAGTVPEETGKPDDIKPEDSKQQLTDDKSIQTPAADSSKLKAEEKEPPAPEVSFKPDVKEGCVPLTVYFDNLSHNYDSCLWDFGDGGKSSDENPVWIFDEEGTYEVVLILYGSDGSRLSEKQIITAYPIPDARFEVSSGDPFIPDEQIRFYNYSQDAVEWEWDLGDGTVSDKFEPTHFYDKPGSYSVTLKVISQHGCVDSMVLVNAFADNSCYIKFPNVFIPNEGGPTGGYYSNRTDQQEQVFHPVWSGVTSYHLSIYSRRGVLMFETDDLDIGWDGYYKGQKAEPGVYIWKARGMFKNGEPFVKGGDLTLLPKW